VWLMLTALTGVMNPGHADMDAAAADCNRHCQSELTVGQSEEIQL